jgi:hypothetical protein
MMWLKENPEISKKIVAEIMAKSRDGGTPVAVGVEEEEEPVAEPSTS